MPLRVHFLNVGQGDCTIIEFPSGHIGVVDIDNLRILDDDTRREFLEQYRETPSYFLAKFANHDLMADEAQYIREREFELTDPLTYFNDHIGRDKCIFRFIITHPDMDHMTGLHRIHEQDPKNILNFWHVGPYDFNLNTKKDDEWGRYDKRDWETYKLLRHSRSDPKAIAPQQGHSLDFWRQDGIEIWAPTPATIGRALELGSSNASSMVLKITYLGKSIVLGGDATSDDTWPSIYPHLDMSSIDVLKASHHGRRSGYHQLSVKEMSPWLTITSVGEKEHDATPKYRRYSDHTVSLRDAGDIVITVRDDGQLYYSKKIEEFWKPKIQ